MNTYINRLHKNQSLIYKIFLFVATTILIVYLFPKAGKFKYDFTKGKPWQYENLYAPFDFAILKNPEEVAEEKLNIEASLTPYFDYNSNVLAQVQKEYRSGFEGYFKALSKSEKKSLLIFGEKVINKIYVYGVVKDTKGYKFHRNIFLKKGNEVEEINVGKLLRTEKLTAYLEKLLADSKFSKHKTNFTALFYDVIRSNVTFNEVLTAKALRAEVNQLLTTRGSIEKGSRVIAKGEVLEGEKLQVLNSLKKEYESQLWSQNNYYWIVFGYSLLVSMALLMLLLFIKKYRPRVFENNTRITFIFFNILLMVFLTTAIITYNTDYIYVIPLCILPLVINAFFDTRLGLFTHVITVLLLGFIVPDSYEYMFLQIMAGIVSILTISELYKRANLFISVGQITMVYIIAYLAFHIIHEGSFQGVNPLDIGLFVLCGLATLMVHPLIYAFEKIFGLVSDVSLLELSDTNSKLLKELADKAPGTLHHSLNVANIAEAAANEIGANAMLVRVGALYHDIGKMLNPTYFTENQSTAVNPHDSLSPIASARIIIGHTIKGIELAKKNKLPDRVIDFIRTHHGTSTVYYFYMKAKEVDENVAITDFQYPGPQPFSRETAILMMADSVEAASKSLKNPTSILIDNLVEKIINKQMENGQFLNADITFKEIQIIKKVMKRKLTNIYHLRIEYPE